MPADPEEAYAMTRVAFAVSDSTGGRSSAVATKAFANPITARKVGKIERNAHERPASFQRNLAKFTKAAPQWCRDQHSDALKRLEHAGELFGKSQGESGSPLLLSIPAVVEHKQRSESKRLGIIVAGVSFTYLQELRQRYPERFADVPVLKLGVVNPLPSSKIRDFLAQIDVALVLEELDPLIETQVLALIAETGLRIELFGKRIELLPRVHTYPPQFF